MSMTIGRGNGLLNQLGQWVLAAVIVGAILNAKDIQRYLAIRSM